MYHKCIEAEARDMQLEYFKRLRKLMKSVPFMHSRHMLTLARYSNKPPGKEPPLMGVQRKKCIFNSFPQSWQQQFIGTGQHVATTQLLDIIEFMSNEKSFADVKALQEGKKKHTEAGNGGKGSHKKGNEAKNRTRTSSKRYLLVPLETRSVESMEDTHGASATTTLVAPVTKGMAMHIPQAVEAKEDFKATGMEAVATEAVAEMGSTILTKLHLQKLQSRDSR
jgi:hypothetical protein